MKVDVVIATYPRQITKYWAWVVWGLQQNAEHIKQVFFCSDGPWSETKLRLEGAVPSQVLFEGLDIAFLEHQRRKFGLCESLNQGMRYVSTDQVLLMEGDEILAPGSMAATLKVAEKTRDEMLICCPKSYVDTSLPSIRDLDEGRLPTFLQEEEDHRLKRWYRPGRKWSICTGGHLLTQTRAHLEIGGFDERFTYGLHDFDYAARWMMENGPSSVDFFPDAGYVWHIGSGKGRKVPSPANHRLFAQTLGKFYGNRYHLACGGKHFPEMCNTDFARCPGADAIMDCKKLDWIPDNSAQLIFHGHFIEHMTYNDAVKHLQDVYRVLKPGGELIIECPDMEKCCKAYLEGKKEPALQGFYSDRERQEENGWGHYMGWDLATLGDLLETIGFEIIEAGDSPSEMCGWRDLRIEACKPEAEELKLDDVVSEAGTA